MQIKYNEWITDWTNEGASKWKELGRLSEELNELTTGLEFKR